VLLQIIRSKRLRPGPVSLDGDRGARHGVGDQIIDAHGAPHLLDQPSRRLQIFGIFHHPPHEEHHRHPPGGNGGRLGPDLPDRDAFIILQDSDLIHCHCRNEIVGTVLAQALPRFCCAPA
jgi:hypothetical protein